MLTAARDFVILLGAIVMVFFIGGNLLIGGFDPSYWTAPITVIPFVPMQRLHVAGACVCCLILLFICLSVFIRHRPLRS